MVFEIPVCLHDSICVTNGTAEDHEREQRKFISKVQDAGYQASETKTELFKRQLTWLGYHKTQNGWKPVRKKTEAITKLQVPKNTKELKSFLGSIQHLSKLISNLSKNTDIQDY